MTRARARGNAKSRGNGGPFPSRLKERSLSRYSTIQSAAISEGNIRRPPSGQKLRAAVAAATADLQVQNRKRRRASLSASTGDQEFAARRSALARPRIKSPITQPEMPERTHATAIPRSAVSIGSRRRVPTAPRRRRPDRNRWPRGDPRARARKRKEHG